MATRITTKIIERDATTAAVDLSVNTNSEKKIENVLKCQKLCVELNVSK